MIDVARLLLQSKSLEFNTAGKGIKLNPVAGYPDNNSMPQLQLTEDGRLNFYSYPDNPYLTDYDRFLEAGNVYQFPRLLPGGFFYYDKEIGNAESGNGEYILQKDSPYFLGVPVIAADKMLVEKFINDGRRLTYSSTGTPENTKGRFRSTWTGLQICSFRGEYVYRALDALDLMFINIQSYVDKSLKTPYPVFGLVPFAKSYPYALKQILLKGSKSDRIPALQKFFGNVNFFEAPVGKMSVLDKVLAYSPAIISLAFSVVSLGAGAPALVASVAALGTNFAQKDMLQKNKIAAEINGYYAGVNISNKKPDTSTQPDGPLPSSPPAESFNKNWIYAGAGILLFLLLMNKRKL